MLEGERQVAPTLGGIRRDHCSRYEWAARLLKGRVADFACGVGYGSWILAEAGIDVTGFDVDEEALEYARKHYAHPRARFVQMDAGKAELPKFDAAVCFETIEHLKDPRPLLKALRQASPVLLASVPNEDVLPYAGYAFHFRHYTRGQFQQVLEECGWKVDAWYGQADVDSDVEKRVRGRTIIASAKRATVEEELPRPAPTTLLGKQLPEHVAILGLGPSVGQFLEITKRLGGRRKFCDEVWGINALGDVVNCDRIFHMDDVRIQEIRAKAAPESNIAAMLKWMRWHPGPIYTSRKHPDYGGLVDFPLEDVINSTGYAYFNSTAAYAVAFAVHIGVKKMTLFGVDFTYPNAHHAEKGRACVEFWLGIAAQRGIKLSVPRESSLMDACHPFDDRLYGYDTVKVDLTERDDGKFSVLFTEREDLPTAEEVEDKYCHARPANVLVEKGYEETAEIK